MNLARISTRREERHWRQPRCVCGCGCLCVGVCVGVSVSKQPRTVPLHEPRKNQHSPGRTALEAAQVCMWVWMSLCGCVCGCVNAAQDGTSA